jgi:hypothetical protein
MVHNVASTHKGHFATKTEEMTVEKELKEIKQKKIGTDRKENMDIKHKKGTYRKENMEIKHKKGTDRIENMEIQRTTLVKNLHRELFDFVGDTRSKNSGRHSSRFH